MNKEEILHLAKKIAQLHKTQVWIYSKMEKALDVLLMEIIKEELHGNSSNTNSDCPRDDGRTILEMDEKVCFTTCEFGAGCSKREEVNEF